MTLEGKGISRKIFESGCGWPGLEAFVVCVQSYKKNSPSSGLFRVKVYNENGIAQRNGTGMFPREVMNRFPLLPLEEEGRLVADTWQYIWMEFFPGEITGLGQFSDASTPSTIL